MKDNMVAVTSLHRRIPLDSWHHFDWRLGMNMHNSGRGGHGGRAGDHRRRHYPAQWAVVVNIVVMVVTGNAVGDRKDVLDLVLQIIIRQGGPWTRLLVLDIRGQDQTHCK